MGKPYRIFTIKLHNRGDAVWERLRNVVVEVGNIVPSRDNLSPIIKGFFPRENNKPKNNRCGFFQGPGGPGQVVEFHCPKSLVGQFVSVRMDGLTADFLTLCEVEIFGY
jgi:hypothetical protein